MCGGFPTWCTGTEEVGGSCVDAKYHGKNHVVLFIQTFCIGV